MESGYGCHVAALPITRMGVQVSGRGDSPGSAKEAGKLSENKYACATEEKIYAMILKLQSAGQSVNRRVLDWVIAGAMCRPIALCSCMWRQRGCHIGASIRLFWDALEEYGLVCFEL